ncbi:MAG: PilZ domain-containing protein [Gammaproteobacteria bacterium]
MHSNRRKYPRLNLRHEFTLRAHGRQLTLATRNLSFSGAFFESEAKLPVATQVAVELHCLNHNVETSARVVYLDKYGFGVEFENSPPSFVDALHALIGEQAAHQNVLTLSATVPARIALLHHGAEGYHILFTSHLNHSGAWVLTETPEAFGDLIRIALSEHGLYECQAKVVWRNDRMLGLKFVDPSEDFSNAYRRIVNAFMH